jgi:hypothetical protein
MAYVLEFSTDTDITAEQADEGWGRIQGRYQWAQVIAYSLPGGRSLNLPDRCDIIVIAHGNANEIGNANPGPVDINAWSFLALIQANMAANAAPGRIFISACAPSGLAEFPAAVSMAAGQNEIWRNTEIYGHTSNVVGPVPVYSERSRAWTVIYP